MLSFCLPCLRGKSPHSASNDIYQSTAATNSNASDDTHDSRARVSHSRVETGEPGASRDDQRVDHFERLPLSLMANIMDLCAGHRDRVSLGMTNRYQQLAFREWLQQSGITSGERPVPTPDNAPVLRRLFPDVQLLKTTAELVRYLRQIPYDLPDETLAVVQIFAKAKAENLSEDEYRALLQAPRRYDRYSSLFTAAANFISPQCRESILLELLGMRDDEIALPTRSSHEDVHIKTLECGNFMLAAMAEVGIRLEASDADNVRIIDYLLSAIRPGGYNNRSLRHAFDKVSRSLVIRQDDNSDQVNQKTRLQAEIKNWIRERANQGPPAISLAVDPYLVDDYFTSLSAVRHDLRNTGFLSAHRHG